MSLVTEVYHEPQKLWRCALHTVNGILGRPAYSVQDFDAISEGLDSRRLLNRHRVLCVGYYDANVVMVALDRCGCDVDWHDKRLGTKGLFDDSARLMGFILNVRKAGWFWWGKHWLGIRRADDGTFWCVDSYLDKPYRFRDVDTVNNFIEHAQQDNGAVLIVKKKQKERDDSIT